MSTVNKVIVTGLLVAAVAAVMLAKSGRLPSPDRPSEQATVGSSALLPDQTSDAGSNPARALTPARLPRLLDLGSNKCIPCKMMATILAELTRTYEETFEVEVIDVWEDRAAAREYAIRVIPTQIFYDASGKEQFRHEGFMSREAILAKWEELGVKVVAIPPGVRSDGS